jgi:NhaP-type Na+/H+ or K+/H+ antiporter
MLGLGLLGVHELGASGWRWFAVDLVWAVAAGIGIGALLGTLLGRLVIFLRREYREGVGLDDFLALGLIALSYGLALVLHAYGFLAVFAAGVALRRVEMRYTGPKPLPDVTGAGLAGGQAEVSVDANKAPAYMAQAVLGFNEQVERIGEVALVVVLGGLLATVPLMPEAFWFVPLLLLVIRPAASLVGMGWSDTSHLQRGLIAWFGIRGIGSIYYLMFAISHGLDAVLARQLTGLTLAVLVVSIVVHGVSVTPLMGWYARKRGVPKSETGPFKKPQSDAKGGRRGSESTVG